MAHRTLTIVFADMQGFTSRTSRQTRAETTQLIQRLRERVQPIVAAAGGTLVKQFGDGFLMTFESPTDAVLAGVKVQEALRAYNATVEPQDRIQVRVAVNTGEVTQEQSDVYGEAVNIAARVQELAEAGSVLLTESTYLAMHRAEVPTIEVGKRALKGIPEAVRIYRVAAEDGWPAFGRRGWLVAALVGVVAVGGLLAARGLSRPPTPEALPAVETPPEVDVLAEAIPADAPAEVPGEVPADVAIEPPPEAPAEPESVPAEDPAAAELLATILQQVQSYNDQHVALREQLSGVESSIRDWRREVARVRLALPRAEGQVAAALQALPGVRENHQQQVNTLVERLRGRGDDYSAGYLTADLAQYEAQAAQWEATLQAHLATLQAGQPSHKELDRTVERAWDELSRVRMDLAGVTSEINALRLLTTWDPRLDQMATTLEALGGRIAALGEATVAVPGELDARQQEMAAAESGLTGWTDFQTQWRTYLTAWR